MRPTILLLLLGLFTAASYADDPVQQWSFGPEQLNERVLTAVTGGLNGTISGPFKPETHPHSLSFVGTSKAGNIIKLTDDLAKANLPKQEMTVEAWVQIDRSQKWGGIIGAIQDNGSYEKGWLLGYNLNKFYFALASETQKKITYMESSIEYATGYWYHLVATYDGKKQLLYVDGELAASSETQRGPIAYPPKALYCMAGYLDDDEDYAMAGRLENVAVWHSVLDPNEINQRYDARKGLFPGIEETSPAQSADHTWPTYQHDNLRSGQTTAELKLPLHLQWTHVCNQAPSPAWPPPAQQDFWHGKQTLKARVTYDRGFHLVSDGDAVYFGSSAEDYVARIDAKTGETTWRFFTEAPVRLAPTLHQDRLYVGSDDGYVYCLNKQTGEQIYKVKPAESTDRKIPGNGRIISPWPIRTSVLIDGKTGFFGAGIFPSQGAYHCSFNLETGELLDTQSLDVSPQGYLEQKNGKLFVPTGRVLAGKFLSGLKRRGKATTAAVKNIPADYPYAFVGTPTLRFGGGENKVAGLDAQTGKEIWSAPIDGTAYSLAIAGERLFVSTDQGKIYGFHPKELSAPTIIQAPAAPALAHPDGDIMMAQDLRNETKILLHQRAKNGRRIGTSLSPQQRQGYALFVGASPTRVAEAATFAAHSELKIIMIDSSTDHIDAARQTVYAQNLAGRITVLQASDYQNLPFTDYLFNMVIASNSTPDLQRVLHPHGLAIYGNKLANRPPLTGIGEWTHLYADASNSTASKETRASPNMQLQWFGAPGPQNMVDRHHRSISSLWKDGRVFIPGNERVYGVDAYNGFVQWETEVPGSRRVGVFRDAGSMAVNTEGLFIAANDTCQMLDVATGEVLRTFNTPIPGEWGYLALIDKLVIGSVVKAGGTRKDHSKTQIYEGTYFDNKPIVVSERLFVLDQATGKTVWEYHPSGALLNPSVSIGNGKVYVLESNNPATLETPVGRVKMDQLVESHGARLVAINLSSGSIAWSENLKFPKQVQNLFTLVAEDADKVAMVFSRNDKTVHYDIRAFDSNDGKLSWEATQNNRNKVNGDHGEQDHHPVATGGKLIVEPYAYDLANGKVLDHKLKRPGHGCGSMSASANALFFRAGSPTVYDFANKDFTKLTKVSRPGCWINMIPAGGLLLIPESSSGCTCNFAVQTSMAFIPKPDAEEK